MEKLDQQEKRSFRRRLTGKASRKDLLLKIISLCLGTLLWYFVVGEDQVDMNIQVPIEILNLPANLAISNNFKKRLDVTVRGPRSIIQNLKNRNISRPVDLSTAEPGAIVIKNTKESIPLPQGISVLQLQPANITLTIDRLIQKALPITTVTEGKVSPGYVLDKITLEPDKIVVTGPQAVLNPARSLKTYVINVNNLNHSITLPVHLNLPVEFIDLIGETVVVAKITVKEKMITKTIRKIPVNARESSQSVKIRPHTISVVAEIAENLIRDTPVPAMLFRAYVNANDIQKTQEMPVVVTGVSVPGHEPITIKSHKPLKVRVSPVKKPQPKKESNKKKAE